MVDRNRFYLYSLFCIIFILRLGLKRWQIIGKSLTILHRRSRKILIIIGLLGIIGIISVYKGVTTNIVKIPKRISDSSKEENFYLQKPGPKDVIILRWTTWFNRKQGGVLLTKKTCPYLHMPLTNNQKDVGRVFKTCRIYFDKRYLPYSGAIVFHSRDLINETILPPRSQNQFWVYQQEESPILTYLNLTAFPNVFNWSMTYRRDSDVYNPYGHIVPVGRNQTQMTHSNIHHLASKPRLALAIMSNCKTHSNRQFFIHEIQKYMPVDIFGYCGSACRKRAYHGDCYEPMSKHYKFYLAFENALCEDYISEKFFKAMKYSMVPVVYGGKGADNYARIAPKNSYIDSRDFKSAKELADYLLYLDRNDDKYLEYLEWKIDHKVIPRQGWCNLCQKVYSQRRQDKHVRRFKWYKDLWKWWNYLGADSHDVVYETRQNDVSRSYYKVKAESLSTRKGFQRIGKTTNCP